MSAYNGSPTCVRVDEGGRCRFESGWGHAFFFFFGCFFLKRILCPFRSLARSLLLSLPVNRILPSIFLPLFLLLFHHLRRTQPSYNIKQQVRVRIQHLTLRRKRDFTVVELEPLVVSPTETDVMPCVHLSDVHHHRRKIIPARRSGGQRSGAAGVEVDGVGARGQVLLFGAMGARGVGEHVELEREVELRVDFGGVELVVLVALGDALEI